MLKFLMSTYIVVLGITIGIVMALGMLVAPIVFHPEKVAIMTTVISHFESGLMMGAIFDRFGGFLTAVLVIVVAMEGYLQGVKKQGCVVDILVASCVVVTSSSFLWYFIPAVKEFQLKGSSVLADPAFQTLHSMSELDFKLLMASLMMLAFARLSKFATTVGDEPEGCCR
jgi:hypothetical protein